MSAAGLTQRVMSLFDRLIIAFAWAGGVILVFALGVALVEVVSRYFFKSPIPGSVEVTEYCLLWMTFLAAPWLQAREAHVRVDFLTNMLPSRAQEMFKAIGSIAASLVCAMVAVYGFKTVWFQYQIDYVLSTPLRPPAALIIVVIPIGCALLAAQFARSAYAAARLWRGDGRSA